MTQAVRLSLFTRWNVECGISVYSNRLMDGLREFPEIENIHLVEAPRFAGRLGTKEALLNYPAEEKRFAKLGRSMAEERANLAHIQHQYFFFGGVAPHKNHARAFLRSVQVPMIMTIHEIAEPPKGAKSLICLALAKVNRLNFVHPAIERLLVHTEQDRLRLLDLKIREERVRVVRHGVPASLPLPEREATKAEMGLKGRRVLTLFGYLSQKKGHSIAVDAIQHLPEDVVLIFAGGRHPDDETRYVSQLKAQVESLGLSARVRFTDYLPESEIPRYLAVTDIALAPFLQTSGSGSLALMLANGIPVAGSPIMPHMEIAQDTPSSLSLLPSLVPAEVAAHLQKLLADSTVCKALSFGATQYAKRHSYREMARETAEIYQEVLSRT